MQHVEGSPALPGRVTGSQGGSAGCRMEQSSSGKMWGPRALQGSDLDPFAQHGRGE